MSDSVVILVVAAALDPVPGAFHTPESARDAVQRILDNSIGHYNPVVRIEPQK